MNEDKVKRLNLMRFWLFGIFVIVAAATFSYIFVWVAQVGAGPVDAVVAALPVWVITAVLAVVWYLGYKWWLGRKDGDIAPAAAMPESASPPPPEPPSPSQPGEGGSEG